MPWKHRALLCLLLQGIIVWYSIAAQQLFRMPPPMTAPAYAEEQFAVEPLPSAIPLTHAPEPTPAPLEDTPVFRLEVIRETASPSPEWAGKRVLIYHTHTWEAYAQTQDAPYQETEKWRTRDESSNVVAVGYALAASLRAMGVTVVHDTTAFEPPNLDDAYERSLAMLESRLAAGEHYDLYIDLHRDAIASTSTIRRTVSIGGEDMARFMVLVGKGTTGGYAEKPDWEQNLAIASSITDSLNDQCDGLARDVKIKTGRFNQHIAPCCVLIECGVNTNSLAEVLRGVPYLAQAVAETLVNLSQNE